MMKFSFEERYLAQTVEVSENFLLGFSKLTSATKPTNSVEALTAQLSSISLKDEETKDEVKAAISLRVLEPQQLKSFITFVESLQTEKIQECLATIEKYGDYLSLARELKEYQINPSAQVLV